MHRTRKVAALRNVLGENVFVKGDEFVAPCPWCGHTGSKKKLSINLITDAFHCWVCGRGHRSSLEPILRLKKESDYYAEYVAEKRPKQEQEERKYAPVVLPKEFRSLSVPSRSPYQAKAMAYLANRGLTADDVLLYRLGYCEDGEYRNRVIIPSFDRLGELNFFVGRDIYDNPQRYKHGEFDKDIIFNDYLVDWDKPVTLVEGPFDAMRLGTNAIPLQGTHFAVDSRLFHKIVHFQKFVYVAIDKDAPQQRQEIVDKLLQFGIQVGILNWDDCYKDPGDIPKDEVNRIYSNPLVISDAFSSLRLKVENSGSFRSH